MHFVASSKQLEQLFLTIGTMKVNSKMDHQNPRAKYVFITTSDADGQRGSIHFSGTELTFRYGTQFARMNGSGHVSLCPSEKKDTKKKRSKS